MAAVKPHMDGLTHEMLCVTAELRVQIADFDDYFGPIRGLFWWERHSCARVRTSAPHC
jgi:putative drug exporter of the RND superfamily